MIEYYDYDFYIHNVVFFLFFCFTLCDYYSIITVIIAIY